MSQDNNNQPVARYKSNMTADDIPLKNATSVLDFKRVNTPVQGDFDEHHSQSIQAMALRKEVIDKRLGRPTQPAVTVAGPLQPIQNQQVENKAAFDAVNGGYNVRPILNASASQQEPEQCELRKKIMDLKHSVDRILESPQASQGANITAIPELVEPELGTATTINTAGNQELVNTAVETEAPTATTINTAGNRELVNTAVESEAATVAAMGTAGTEVGTVAALNTAEFPDAWPYTPAYPSSLWTESPNFLKPNDPRHKPLRPIASKPAMAKQPTAVANNLVGQSMWPHGPTGNIDSTHFPSILGKHTLPGQKGEKSRPAKKRSNVKFDLPPVLPKKAVGKSAGAAASPPKSKKKSGPPPPATPPPPRVQLGTPPLLINPAGQPSYASIIAAAPPDRPAIFLGDDLARARGLDPLAPTGNWRDRFTRRPDLLYPHAAEDPVPQSWIEAEEPDRMLFLLHESGADWESMTKEWYTLTGTWQVGDVLPQRLAKFKENMMELKDEDAQRLLNAARDVDADYRSSKWEMIADRLIEYGGGEYPTTFLQKKHRELEFEKQLEQGWS